MNVRGSPVTPISMVLLAGLSALVVVMGIGRFAYTPILPLMQDGEGFSEAVAGLIAMANYAGYFLAALFSFVFTKRGVRTVWLRTHFMLNVLTTGAMGWVESVPLWLIIRFLSGWSSGIVFVITSNMVLERLFFERRSQWLSGVIYSGVGLGIALSGMAVPLLSVREGWRGAWWGLMAFSALAVPLIWYGLRDANLPLSRNASEKPKMSVGPNSSPNEQHLGRPGDATQQLSGTTLYRWLVAAYGFEGLGYIVSGTFLVAAVVSWPGLESYGALSWVLVGLAAAPSTMIWGLLANRFGEPRALLAAYLLQVAGVVMPVVFLHWSTVFLGAVLFGGTFMGIVTLSMNAGRNLAPHNGRVVGQLTAAYGLGQMIGPMAAGAMATWTGGYEIPLMFAGCLVLAGAGALIPLMVRRYERSVNLSSQ